MGLCLEWECPRVLLSRASSLSAQRRRAQDVATGIRGHLGRYSVLREVSAESSRWQAAGSRGHLSAASNPPPKPDQTCQTLPHMPFSPPPTSPSELQTRKLRHTGLHTRPKLGASPTCWAANSPPQATHPKLGTSARNSGRDRPLPPSVDCVYSFACRPRNWARWARCNPSVLLRASALRPDLKAWTWTRLDLDLEDLDPPATTRAAYMSRAISCPPTAAAAATATATATAALLIG